MSGKLVIEKQEEEKKSEKEQSNWVLWENIK